MTSQFEQGHSPAVRAILNAYRDASWAPDIKDPNKHHKWSHKAGLAAALRDLATRIKGADCICQDIYDIAAELEAQ